MNKISTFPLFAFLFAWHASAQTWQQQANYEIEVSMDVKSYKYTGKQQIVYSNNSPDTLRKVFFHLYNNAFQPGSEMDMRLQNIPDPDRRMVNTVKTSDGKEVKESRIKNLKPDEIGYLNIADFTHDGQPLTTKVLGTILEVTLKKPILPRTQTRFAMQFEGQVPVQIRRSGRNNNEGVALSMAQWYPKLAAYDEEGWHPNPYIAREFYGNWGDFDVKITIDKNYVLGGTGYLQNPNAIGHGYEDEGVKVVHPRKTKTLTWHFVAPKVHDFTWAADPKYRHDKIIGPNNVELHFLYLDNEPHGEKWRRLQPLTAKLLEYFNTHIGPYPYKQYSVIQGGDGGMEYGMCTLILGTGTFDGLLGVTAHELAHSWFQFVLAFNESKHYWMDEGFTNYIETLAVNAVTGYPDPNPLKGSYDNYYYLVRSGREQPLSTHADHHDYNQAYSISAYSKGSVFLSQLGYLIGQQNLSETLKRFYREFQFKQPKPNDFKRVAEKVSGAQLDWYLTEWTQTTSFIDYAISDVTANTSETKVTLSRLGRMPMPIDLVVTYENGDQEYFYIPLRMMHFEKPNPYPELKATTLADWPWAQPDYAFSIPAKNGKIAEIRIDPSGMMADVNQENNSVKP